MTEKQEKKSLEQAIREDDSATYTDTEFTLLLIANSNADTRKVKKDSSPKE